MQTLPLTDAEIAAILAQFGLSGLPVTDFCDTSHQDGDIRWNLMLDHQYVLKINARIGMWEARLQEISRLIARYRAIGLYCPALLPTLQGDLSCTITKDGVECTCFVEEYAKYPTFDWDSAQDRRDIVEHLGVLAARYTNVDLSPIRSMWSIIDLSPFDKDVDEKQENADALADALRENGFASLADQVNALNERLRSAIQADFADLPRCVYQGDLNSSNELHDNGRFVGLIDFNCSGTDVNINVFACETQWFPEEAAFDALSVEEILQKMEQEQDDTLAVILRHYILNPLETRLFPHYRRIADLFQYPNVCAMSEWLAQPQRREKCAALIRALVEKPL